MILEEFNRKALDVDSKAIWLNIAGETLSFSEQVDRLQKLQAWLKENELFDKGPILVAVEDELERISLIVALISIGLPSIIFDSAGTKYEAERILNNCNFCAVIGEEKIYQKLSLSDYAIPYLEVTKQRKKAGVFGRVLKEKAVEKTLVSWPMMGNNQAISEPDEITGSNKTSYDDLALVVFTSGTTSNSKGVEIQYSALLSQLTTLKNQYKLDKSSRILNVLPLHHVDGLIQGPFMSWYTGSTLYRPCDFSAQNLSNFLNSIYRERITHLISVPTMLSLIYRLGQEWRENFESPDLKFVVSCAGHLETSLWQSFEKDFSVRVVNMYGLTETVTSALFSGPDDESRCIGTLGKPINSEIKIIDSNGEIVKHGEIGELLISSPQLMRGYHRDVESSSQILNNGWLSSGDLVRELDTGHIELVGRKKNQIISGGKNISPEEVSEVINLHNGVIESIVLGQVDQDWGESVCALVVCDGKTTSNFDLISWCRARLSEYKIPRHLFIVNDLAKGPSGKILIKDARKQLEREMLSLKNNNKDKTIDSQVLAISASVFRIERSELNDLSSPANTDGWDSLAHMNLVLEIEKTFDIELSTRDIMHIDSIKRAIEICRIKLEG